MPRRRSSQGSTTQATATNSDQHRAVLRLPVLQPGIRTPVGHRILECVRQFVPGTRIYVHRPVLRLFEYCHLQVITGDRLDFFMIELDPHETNENPSPGSYASWIFEQVAVHPNRRSRIQYIEWLKREVEAGTEFDVQLPDGNFDTDGFFQRVDSSTGRRFNYNVLETNCETFTTWLVTGVETHRGSQRNRFLVTVLIVLVLALIFGKDLRRLRFAEITSVFGGIVAYILILHSCQGLRSTPRESITRYVFGMVLLLYVAAIPDAHPGIVRTLQALSVIVPLVGAYRSLTRR